MSSLIYNRIVKLCADSMPDKLNIVYMAILNLNTEKDIIEFTNNYRIFYSTWKNDISYTLKMFDNSKKKLWNNSLKKMNINISELLNINPIKLYNHFDFIDEKGKKLKPYYNKEKGHHQSK